MPRWDNAPQAHSRVSNINFDIWKQIVDGGLYKNPIKKYIKDGKVLAHFKIKLKVLPGSLSDLST
jgi:hypothetical protein